MTRDDLIDLIIGHLRAAQGASAPSSDIPRNSKSESQPRGRPFLTEYDIKKRLTAGQTGLTIPKDAILSPLAADWLVLRGIEVTRE